MRGSNSYSRHAKKPPKRRQAAGFLLSSSHVVYNDAYVEDADDEAALVALEMRLDWDRVCCVLLAPQTCPVCLDSPAMCPMVLPCGHCYCSACVVELQSRGASTCLVCKGAFCLLRPARFVGGALSPQLAVGKSERFCLVVRKKDASVVWPFEEWEKRWREGVTCACLPLVSDRASRFSPALVAREEDELAEFATLMDAHVASICDDVLEREGMPNWLEARSQLQKKLAGASALPQSARSFVTASRKSSAGIDDFVFFYQAESGEPVFLNALMSKMLMHQAQQDPLKLPQTVTCKLQEIDTFDRDEKTPKVFAHLPVGTHYSCVEGIVAEVSKDTVKAFREELNVRSRQRKARAERARARDSKFEEETRQRLMKQAKEMGQPAQLLLYEEMIHDPPALDIVEAEVRHKPEKKFLSYAAVASPDGASYNAAPNDFPGIPAAATAATSPTRPSFADKVKAAAPPAPASSSSPPDGKGKQKFVTLSVSGGGGGRRYN